MRGAKAGQSPEVRIKAIDLNYDRGYNSFDRSLAHCPTISRVPGIIHIPIDRARMVGRLPWGLELPLKPFFGIGGCGNRRLHGGRLPHRHRRNGGNMDNKELVAGTTPLFADPC